MCPSFYIFDPNTQLNSCADLDAFFVRPAQKLKERFYKLYSILQRILAVIQHFYPIRILIIDFHIIDQTTLVRYGSPMT